MKVKKLEKFYKDNKLKVNFDKDNMPILNGIDCMCDVEKCPNGYSCHDGTPCSKFKPNRRFYIWQKNGKSAKDIDWDKEYIRKKPENPRIKELEERIAKLEEKLK